jgi:hypothetical protein
MGRRGAPSGQLPLNSVQTPAKANKGLSSLSANHTTSFLPVTGFDAGAYSAKLFCWDKAPTLRLQPSSPVRRRRVPDVRDQRIITISRSEPALRTTGAG